MCKYCKIVLRDNSIFFRAKVRKNKRLIKRLRRIGKSLLVLVFLNILGNLGVFNKKAYMHVLVIGALSDSVIYTFAVVCMLDEWKEICFSCKTRLTTSPYIQDCINRVLTFCSFFGFALVYTIYRVQIITET